MVVSWGSLLDAMAAGSDDGGESRAVTQIRQLRSLARYTDKEAFKPIPQGNESGTDAEMPIPAASSMPQRKRVLTRIGQTAGD